MQEIQYKLLITFFGLTCYTLLTTPLVKANQRQKIPNSNFDNLELDQQKPLEQTTGIILLFHKWPSKKEQTRISKKLQKEELILTKKFKIFKSLVFSWKKLKTKKRAENICSQISGLKNLNYCEPDMLLQSNSSSNKETEAGSVSCTVDCDQTPHNISILQDTLKEIAPESCELLPSKYQLKEGKLSDYWAQEMAGTDLLREELEKINPLPKNKFLIAVFDGPRGDHNTHVQNLISHKKDQAVLPALNTSQIQFFQTSGSSQYMDVVQNLILNSTNQQNIKNTESSIEGDVKSMTEPSKQLPSFINNSRVWGNSQPIYEAISQIHPPAILIQAAGNSYPSPLGSVANQFSKDFDSILVGSLSPSGLVNYDSQEGEEIHILAPAGDYITSIGSDGKYKKFGGTSGATPLVTGALAGFEWLSGYHPTPEEAKLLLKQTAMPTIHSVFENPQRNGVGMLNAYKLGRVAKRLKEKCNTNLDCFKREVRYPENYEFSIDKEEILKQVSLAFPICSGQDNTQEVSCEDKKSVFKNLRRVILLDIENINLLERLHCIYKQEGFLENAFNVKSMIIAVTRDEDQSLKHLEQIIQDAPTNARKPFSLAINDIGGKKGLELLKNVFSQNSSEEIRVQFMLAIFSTLGYEKGLKLLEQLAQDSSKQVRATAAWAIGDIGSLQGLKLLKPLTQDSDEQVRKTAIKAIQAIQYIQNKNK